MDKKLVVLIFLILASTVVIYSYFTNGITIVRKDVITDFSGTSVVNKPESEEDYLIKYKNENFSISKFIFLNSNVASSFYDEFLSAANESYTNEESINIKEYFGLIVKSLEIERAGIIIKKNNIVIIATGKEKESLIKVVEWFIENY